MEKDYHASSTALSQSRLVLGHHDLRLTFRRRPGAKPWDSRRASRGGTGVGWPRILWQPKFVHENGLPPPRLRTYCCT